jgi:23S rRNA pseudouridine1911/1915/1917 synthase
MSKESKGRAREFQVAGEESGTRLDLFLAEKLACSRGEVRRMLRSGFVRLDGKTVGERAKGTVLSGGQHLELKDDRPANALEALPAPENPLPVLGQGLGWLALDKPAGTPVHPLSEAESNSLLNALIDRYPEIQGVGEGGLRSGVVHRLDLDTSGVILFATEESRWQQLREAFKTHEVDKRYRTLVAGKLAGEGTESLWLRVAQHRPALVRVVEPETAGAFLTRLSWSCLETFDTASLLEVQLETGFLHQVRATLAHMGHPVLGDALYGAPSTALPSRQMLHAASLEWGEIRVSSADPQDFTACLTSLREGNL